MSTKTCGPDSRLKNKHPLAIHGGNRAGKQKRRRSSAEEGENKREQESQSDTEASSFKSDIESELDLEMKTETKGNASTSTSLGADIHVHIISALIDDKLMEMLSKACAKQIIQVLNSKIKDLAGKGEEAERGWIP